MLKDMSDTRDDMTEMVRLVRINITGMTCQSCVRNIETFLSDQPGVESVVVSLERATATVGYDWSVTDQHIIAGRTQNSELRTSLTINIPSHTVPLVTLHVMCVSMCACVTSVTLQVANMSSLFTLLTISCAEQSHGSCYGIIRL